MEERRKYPMSYWFQKGTGLQRFRLENGEMVLPLLPLNLSEKVNRAAASTSPLKFDEYDFLSFLNEGRLEPTQWLVKQCFVCGGSGAVGGEGEEELCPVCQGHGRTMTAFALEVVELWNFIKHSKPLVTEAELEKRNRINTLRQKIEQEKNNATHSIRLTLGGEVKIAQWEAEAIAQKRVAERQQKALKAVEKKLAAEIEELARLEAEEGGES